MHVECETSVEALTSAGTEALDAKSHSVAWRILPNVCHDTEETFQRDLSGIDVCCSSGQSHGAHSGSRRAGAEDILSSRSASGGNDVRPTRSTCSLSLSQHAVIKGHTFASVRSKRWS